MMIPPFLATWLAGKGFKIAGVLVILVVLGGAWWYVHSLVEAKAKAIAVLNEQKEENRKQKELHEAQEALLKMSIAGHEAAREADVRNGLIISELNEEAAKQDRLLRRSLQEQARRLDELFKVYDEATATWSTTIHPQLVTECLQFLARQTLGGGEGDSSSTAPSGCNLPTIGVVQPD